MAAEWIRPGQLVVSRAGRDTGQAYVALALDNDSRVIVADGVRRRLQNPKRKNIKHLRYLRGPDPEMERKFASGERIRNADIRRALQVLSGEGGLQ